MALDADRLAGAIKANMDAALGSVTGADDTNRLKLCQSIANAVVGEITNHAQVNVDHVTGVSAGSSNSGSGTGTVS